MRKVFQITIAGIFLPLFLFSITTVCRSQVVINEFMADPAMDWDGDGQQNYCDDEWVEIRNTGDSTVDLSVYLIADGADVAQWRYGFSGQLLPGEERVVFGSDSKVWEESNNLPRYGLSLNNNGDRISLYIVESGDTTCVDYYSYPEELASDDRSVGRSMDPDEDWVIYDAYNPCDGGCILPSNGCIPTPGSPNDCTTGTESTSWGTIKLKYSD